MAIRNLIPCFQSSVRLGEGNAASGVRSRNANNSASSIRPHLVQSPRDEHWVWQLPNEHGFRSLLKNSADTAETRYL
jgi:hypothetical protein